MKEEKAQKMLVREGLSSQGAPHDILPSGESRLEAELKAELKSLEKVTGPAKVMVPIRRRLLLERLQYARWAKENPRRARTLEQTARNLGRAYALYRLAEQARNRPGVEMIRRGGEVKLNIGMRKKAEITPSPPPDGGSFAEQLAAKDLKERYERFLARLAQEQAGPVPSPEKPVTPEHRIRDAVKRSRGKMLSRLFGGAEDE